MFDVEGNSAHFVTLTLDTPQTPITTPIESAASVILTPRALPNGVSTTLAETNFNSQGPDIVFNASNQIVVNVSAFYIIWANVLTTRSGGSVTTGFITIVINGSVNNGVDAYSTSNTDEEIASAMFIGFIEAGSTIEVATTVFNNNVNMTRGALGIGMF